MFGKIKSGLGQMSRSQKSQDNILNAGNAAAAQIPANPPLQAKIIAYFANGKNPNALTTKAPTPTPGQRQQVQAQLASGKISTPDIQAFLLQVAPTPTQLDNIFQQISQTPRERQILAVATGYDASNWQNLNLADLQNFLAAPTKGEIDYRTPVGFAKYRQQFLEGIKPQAAPEQMAAYQAAMDQLERHLYGAQFDYYQQIQLLKQNQSTAEPTPATAEDAAFQAIIAEETHTAQPTPAANLPTALSAQAANPSSQPATITPSNSAQPLSSNNYSVLTAVTPERSAEVLARATIAGDPWRQDGNDYRLTTTNLASSGLTPAYEMTLDQQTILFSEPFQLSDGRGAILGYALNNDTVKVRSYYLNNKTGLWHFAPDIIRGPRGEGMSQIGEGYSLASTMLPVALQQQLCELSRVRGFRELTTVNADFVFAGTTDAYNTQQDYREALARGQMRNDFYKEVDKTPIAENWQPSGKNKNVPQLLSINANLAPNFQAFVNKFTSYSILAGQVSAESFQSHDGQAIWLFCSDDWGRAWVGNIETISPVTSTGCRRDWMAAGDMVTPLYVPSTQSANYADPNDTRKGLVGMWNQYLSKIPVIREFCAQRGKH